MPDVSRVEYDAALTRVRALRAVPEPVADPDRYIIAVTLAALGLDEPPTEATHSGIPDDFWRAVPCGHPSDPVAMPADNGGWTCHCAGGLDPKDAISDGTMEGAPGPLVPCGKCGCCVAIPLVVPPSEPPKACPTCRGDGAFFDCDACNGSGIDGGTA